MPGPVIDPHFHLWELSKHRYPWLTASPAPIQVAGDTTPIARDYVLDDYLRDFAAEGLVKAVHIDAGWDYADPVGETRWLQGIADRHGFPHGIVARAELDSPDIGDVLAEHAGFPNVRGIRHIANWHPDRTKTYIERPDLLADGAWRAGFARLAPLNLSFDLQIYPAQMAAAAQLAADFPHTSIILNHAGMPVDKDADGMAAWRSGMAALAERDNVTVKISGLGMLDWNWTIDSIRPYVLETIDRFGPKRAMFASNFPVDKLYSSLPALYDAFRAITGDLSESETHDLFYATAERVYRLQPS
jgi:predicted TIM-barrel fold metal-dependent hydrolase